MADKVCNSRGYRCESCQLVNLAEGISVRWASLALVVVRQKLSSVGGDINICRAFRFACFARQTQIERFLDVFIMPSARDHFALQQLKQHMSTATCAVLFFQGHHVTRAHRTAILLATLSQSQTT